MVLVGSNTRSSDDDLLHIDFQVINSELCK
jgi:hypothetical protein